LSGIEYEPKNILEVGCGLDAVSNVIKGKWANANVTGINISENHINFAKNKFPDYDFEVMDATKLTIESDSIDLLVSIEAANLFNTRIDFLKEAYRVMKPNSSICMSDLCLRNEEKYARLYIFNVARFNYIEGIEQYKDILSSIGFKNIVVKDMKSKTWDVWIKKLVNFATQAYENNDLDYETYIGWVSSKELLENAAEYYLYVRAEK
jgi:ubiquinone/menaquinone biosynthesis C-methylase UbiE